MAEVIRANFSTNYWAKIKRIQRLPRLYEETVDTYVRRDAVGVIDEFEKGLMKRTFRLEPLKPETVERKRRMGFPKPLNPLGLFSLLGPLRLLPGQHLPSRRICPLGTNGILKFRVELRSHVSGEYAIRPRCMVLHIHVQPLDPAKNVVVRVGGIGRRFFPCLLPG